MCLRPRSVAQTQPPRTRAKTVSKRKAPRLLAVIEKRRSQMRLIIITVMVTIKKGTSSAKEALQRRKLWKRRTRTRTRPWRTLSTLSRIEC